jgi:hypothetical protein
VEPDVAEAEASAELDPSGTAGGGALAGVRSVVTESSAPEYVPMSEWIGDFDSRSQQS